MTDKTALRPFDPNLKTKLVVVAGTHGIAASIYQEEPSSVWVPIDHASRSLTPCEQRYHQIERESLAVAWGMDIHRYYLLGIHFECYTDHQPLIPIYANINKAGPARVGRHRLYTQHFNFTMKYIPGKGNPCDYNSRHPTPLGTERQDKRGYMPPSYEDDVMINKIITDDLPDAVTLSMVQATTTKDATLQELIKCINKGYISKNPVLREYIKIFHELTFTEGVILRNNRLVIPSRELAPGQGNLRQLVIDLAHERHQGESKCKQLLRSRIWFPKMDKRIQEKVQGCLGCQATTYTPTRDPLQPTVLPSQPWQQINMDFWGPLPSREHILVIIDEYSRYPVVEFTTSTSAKYVVPIIDKVFATLRFPQKVKTDGGPPFNGTDSHEYKVYMK